MKLFKLLQEIPPNETALLAEGISILLRLLAPITPHICCELWQQLGYQGDLLHAPWPMKRQILKH
jgi:leucyl-tRNA synthetase